jgi:hypothetical protein
MSDKQEFKAPTEHDRLIGRPDSTALPSKIDPANPHPANFPDPKPVAKEGQGDPDATDPAPDDIGRAT